MSYPNIYTSSSELAQSNYSLFDNKISNYLNEAESFAANIVNPLTNIAAIRAIKESRVSTAYYVLGSAAYSWSNSFNHFNSLNTSQDDDSVPRRDLMTIIEIIVKQISSYFVIHIVKSKKCIESTLNYLGSFKIMIERESQNHYQHSHLKAIKKVIDCEQAIFKKMEEIIEIKVALLVSAAAAGALIFIGALAFSQSILAMGTIIGFGTALVFIFNNSYKHGEKSISVHAKTMLAALERLRNGSKIIYSQPIGDICEQNQMPANVFKSSTEHSESPQGSNSEAYETSKTQMTSVLPVPVKKTETVDPKNLKEPITNSFTIKEISSVSHYPSPISDGTANYLIPCN